MLRKAERHTTRRKPNHLLTLQIGDTADDQRVFQAFFHSAPGGECDNMIVVLKLVTNLIKGNNFGVEVKGSAESSRGKLTKKVASFILLIRRKGSSDSTS